MSNDWFRSWHGAPTDNKWLVIARKAGTSPAVVSAIVWALLDHASQSDDRGSVAGFDVETYAAFSGLEEAQIQTVIGALTHKDIIGPDGGFTNWNRRQPKREDGSADRSREWRDRRRTGGERARTQANADERQDKRREESDMTLADAKDAAASQPADISGEIIRHPGHTAKHTAKHTATYTDAVHELFGEGVPALVSLGVPERQARSMIGSWRKQAREDCKSVLRAVIHARDQRVSDPVPYITASLKTRERHEQPSNTSDLAGAFDRFDERYDALGGS
ncbi:hypothetical protein [Microvirga sp. M2]|uniref:hypothetical protein n=1 Tax=Microvirga sp. M2 TaxID=3073270 RepID=UPI0039C28CBA